MANLEQWTSFATSDVTPLATPAVIQGIARQPIPFNKLARVSGWGEVQNLSAFTNDVSKIQAYIRAAERGDMTMLYALIRDIICGDSHIQSEFGKRKLVVAGQLADIQPIDEDNPDDLKASDACKWMIDHCDNWDEGLLHLLDATLISAVAAEKIYDDRVNGNKFNLRYRLARIEPVNYTLLTYLVAYIPQGSIGLPSYAGMLGGSQVMPLSGITGFGQPGQNPAMVYDPDDWEADLRFYSVFPNGMVNRSWSAMYKPMPNRHVIHRANLFPGIRDNYNAASRALVFWWFLGAQGRDWWARSMERYGSPFLKGKVDSQSVDAMNAIQSAFSAASKLFGIVVDKKAEVDIVQAQSAQMSESYERFLNFINREKSKMILGHADASESKSEGLTKGTGNLVVDVRDDFRMFDQRMIGNTIRTQIFEPFLRYNGLAGEPPRIVWGGESNEDNEVTAKTLASLKQAGIQPTDDAFGPLSERFGMKLERAPDPVPMNRADGSKMHVDNREMADAR